MRFIVIATLMLLPGCGDDGSSSGGSSSCGQQTTGLSGEGPTCSNSLECGGDEWELACDGTGTGECTCTKNQQLEKTIPYDDSFCPADFSNADFDAHERAAREACGWP